MLDPQVVPSSLKIHVRIVDELQSFVASSAAHAMETVVDGAFVVGRNSDESSEMVAV